MFTHFARNHMPWRVEDPSQFRGDLQRLRHLARKLQAHERALRVLPVSLPQLRGPWLKDRSGEARRQQLVEATELWLRRKHRLTPADCCKLHARFMGLRESRLRTIPSRILSVEGKHTMDKPAAAELPGLMRDLEHWYAGRHGETLIAGFVVHLLVCAIHPFADGNGRVSRALEMQHFRRLGVPPVGPWRSELVTSLDLGGYNRAHEQAAKHRCADPFVSFMLGQYLGWGEALLQQVRR